jgi:Domain of unknown function (DUF4314)
MIPEEEQFMALLRAPCPCPVGTRIELIELADDPRDPNPISPGTRGTVSGGNGYQVLVDWDDESWLALLVGRDRYRVLDEKEP